MAKALEGVLVLELTQVLAGPFICTNLANFGADVIWIEPPTGGFYHLRQQPGRSLAENKRTNWLRHRNRKSVTINLKSQKGKEIFLDLVKKADVVVQNFSVGTMEKLGLGYDALKKAKPDIIYCAVSGYGQTGPYKDRPAYDPIIQADSGIMSMTGFPENPPVKVGVSISDFSGAVYALIGILIALYYKQLTGKGQMIDASLLDSMCQWTLTHMWMTKRPGAPERYGNRFPAAILDVHETKDGKHLILTALTDEQWERLLKLIGKEEIIAEKWDSHVRVFERRDEAESWISEWVKTKNLDEAINELIAIGIPATTVVRGADLDTHPQITARELLVDIDDTEVGKISGIISPAPKLSQTPGIIDIKKPPPELGQHTEEILSKILGYSKGKIAKLKEEGVV